MRLLDVRTVAAAAGATLPPALAAWLLSLHGTTGLYYSTWVARLPFFALGGLGIAVAVAAVLGARRAHRTEAHGSSYFRVAAATGIILPLAIFGYLGSAPLLRAGDKPPLLLLADGSGPNGIPGMTVTFWTQAPTQNALRWGTGGETSSLAETTPSRQHAFMLRGLRPSTEYWYQINQGDIQPFRTPPGPGQPLRFAVASDAHFGASSARPDLAGSILQNIGNPVNRFNLFFLIGDIVNYGYSDPMWQEAIQALSRNVSAVPLRTSPGNHDTLLGGLRLYQDYFYPESIDVATGSRLWQRIDLNDIHFLVLDIEWRLEQPVVQKQWLERQLAAIPREHWTFVLGHGIYYSSGVVQWGAPRWDDEDAIRELTPLFERYRVPLVFSGHNHHAEFLQRNGVSYAITGPAGGDPDPEATYVSPASVWRTSRQRSFIEVAVEGTRATATFRDPAYRALATFTLAR